jgi:ABC-type spermidine/putrescine transport system permease subunit II
VRRSRTLQIALGVYTLLVLVFLYVPIIPPLVLSLRAPDRSGTTLESYSQIGQNPVLASSIQTTLVLGILTAVITSLLALLAARAVRELGAARPILLLILLPLFIPGISMGLASAFFFQQLGITPSLWTMLSVQILWALPFAFLIILTAMAIFDPVYLEAAYVHGANRLRAFRDVELPLIGRGILGGAIFSFILSLNETVRTQLVEGAHNTVQTYIWSTYLQVGLSPTLYALMTLLILATLLFVLVLLLVNIRRLRRAALAS